MHLAAAAAAASWLAALLLWAALAAHCTPSDDLWDYEPRLWGPAVEPSQQAEEPFEDEPGQYVDHEQLASVAAGEFGAPSQAGQRRAYFVRSADRLELGPNNNNNIRPLSRQASSEKVCDQFRVDIHDAVICDARRCDKHDFVWPKHDNQLVLVQTTRQGMRFHRQDFAFARPPGAAAGSRSQRDLKLDDLFDLFKPKPASTSTTTSTTAKPEEQTTTPAPSTDQPPTTPASPEAADKNDTQLVTTFRLDTGRPKQQMIGFGGALSDATCRNVKSLSPPMAKSLMEDYFGDRGLRYNIVRMSIGSSDFSTSPYTNNDRPKSTRVVAAAEPNDQTNQDDDVEMANFRLVSEDYDYKLPVARQAIASSRQRLHFLASLWSPPTWMKNNSHIVHGYLKGDVYGPYYKALADLIALWLEAYQRNGVDFWATTALNEPVTGVMPFIFHNSLGMTREDYVTFLKLHMAPALRRRGLDALKLIMLDDNKGYLPGWVKAALSDPELDKLISGVAVHWYMNDEYENMALVARRYPQKFMLSSEACNGYLPYQRHALPGDWNRGVAYMLDIIKTVQNNAAAWIDWNMALDLSGGPSWAKNNLDAAVIVNAKRDEYYKSPMFYAIGHASKFVEPNSTRLDYRLANARYDYPLEAVGFYTPSKHVVIVALNANRHSIPFRVIVDKRLVRVVTLRPDSFNTIVFRWQRKQ